MPRGNGVGGGDDGASRCSSSFSLSSSVFLPLGHRAVVFSSPSFPLMISRRHRRRHPVVHRRRRRRRRHFLKKALSILTKRKNATTHHHHHKKEEAFSSKAYPRPRLKRRRRRRRRRRKLSLSLSLSLSNAGVLSSSRHNARERALSSLHFLSMSLGYHTFFWVEGLELLSHNDKKAVWCRFFSKRSLFAREKRHTHM